MFRKNGKQSEDRRSDEDPALVPRNKQATLPTVTKGGSSGAGADGVRPDVKEGDNSSGSFGKTFDKDAWLLKKAVQENARRRSKRIQATDSDAFP